MKHTWVVAFLLVLAGLLPQPLRAWDNTGHEVVAGIAWDNMTAAARQKAVALLGAAPANACLRSLLPNDARPLAVRQREFFIRAATWPDRVRSGPCVQFNQEDWHFLDHYWEGMSGTTGSSAPHNRTDIAMANTNAVERLTAFRPIVACAAAPCKTDGERAIDLAWMLHLTGDIHQPLHSASRVTTTSPPPKGDRGGNAFLLGSDPNKKLHAYWDHIIDDSIAHVAGEAPDDSIAYLNRVIGIIEEDQPRAAFVAHLQPGNFNAWSSEGFETAKRVAYPQRLHEGQPPDGAYRAHVFTVAEEAIALAGYRLADLLNGMLH